MNSIRLLTHSIKKIVELNNRILVLVQENARLQTKVKEQETVIAEQKAHIAELETQVAEQLAKITALTENLENVMRRLKRTLVRLLI